MAGVQDRDGLNVDKEPNSTWYFMLWADLQLGVLRVITRPEIDPTRSKQHKMPDPYPTRKFEAANYPTRPVPENFKFDPVEPYF